MKRWRRGRGSVSIATAVFLLSAPAAADSFSTATARRHIEMLAGTIGSRPVGSPANARARAYLIDQLGRLGLDVRVQRAEARRPELGRTARVANIIATGEGQRPRIGLIAHYDSSPDSPGAADDGLGVAVCLEVARAWLADSRRAHGLAVILTDGEEVGLMGAAGLLDAGVVDELGVYLNLEAIGSSGPGLLFEAGPGAAWVLAAWRAAPRPRGSSLATAIYRYLPNDTDFSILERTSIPGLNFAPIRDSYAYHTARDTASRLTDDTIEQLGSNALAIVRSLDVTDLKRQSTEPSVYFDLFGRRGLSYGMTTQRWLSWVAVILGLAATTRSILRVRRTDGLRRFGWTAVWAIIGAGATLAAAAAVPRLLRALSGMSNPWHAHPERLFLATGIAGLAMGWAAWRAGCRLPFVLRGSARPEAVWALALPVWTLLTLVTSWRSPAAAYLPALPLLTAGVLICSLPLTRPMAIRAASAGVLIVVGSLWISPLFDLMGFVTPMLSRLPVVAPTLLFPGLLAAGAAMLAPPLLAAGMTWRGGRVVPAADLLVTLLTVGSLVWAYMAPAYTGERPERRSVRFVQESGDVRAYWEVGGLEADARVVRGGSRLDWEPVNGPPPVRSRVPAMNRPFVVRWSGPAIGVPPGTVTAALDRRSDGLDLRVEVQPLQSDLVVELRLPAGGVPRTASLPGTATRAGGWVATYVAPDPEGLSLTAEFAPDQADAIAAGSVLLRTRRVPGGVGWQQLPGWLPRERTVWSGEAVYAYPLSMVLERAG